MRVLHRLISAVLVVILTTTGAAHGAAPELKIGTNFTGSTYGRDSNAVPPDTDGAVGSHHIAELINDGYAVYRKSNGHRLRASSLRQFWVDAGVTASINPADPRILFDPETRRWFASSASFNGGNGPDALLVAASKSDDPTQGWAGFAVPFSGPVGTFVDMPTLGMDRDRIYVASNGAVLVVAKSDLLAASPTIANAVFVASPELLTPTGGTVQPVVDADGTAGSHAVLGTWDVEGVFFRLWTIGDVAGTPVLTGAGTLIPVTPFLGLGNQGALQPDSGIGISTVSQKFTSSIVRRNGVLWGVHTIAHQGRAALRWFRIDASSGTLLEEGLIADPVMDVFMGSIAVNACDDVVIGFNESGTNQFASAYAVAGSTAGNVTTFGEPLLLKPGVARYEVTGGSINARWGDYSATAVDPRHPLTFWTFQEWPSAHNVWSTQVTELRLKKAGGPQQMRCRG